MTSTMPDTVPITPKLASRLAAKWNTNRQSPPLLCHPGLDEWLDAMEQLVKIARLMQGRVNTGSAYCNGLVRRFRSINGQLQEWPTATSGSTPRLTTPAKIIALEILSLAANYECVYMPHSGRIGVKMPLVDLFDPDTGRSHEVGDFWITLDSSGVQVVPTDSTPMCAQQTHIHPHVDGLGPWPCLGRAESSIVRALQSGFLCEAATTVIDVLSRYNIDSPYFRLSRWDWTPARWQCATCGEVRRVEDMVECGCEPDEDYDEDLPDEENVDPGNRHCPDCATRCGGNWLCSECGEECSCGVLTTHTDSCICGEDICDECRVVCDCGESRCEDCTAEADCGEADCGAMVCNSCVKTCDECGYTSCGHCAHECDCGRIVCSECFTEDYTCSCEEDE